MVWLAGVLPSRRGRSPGCLESLSMLQDEEVDVQIELGGEQKPVEYFQGDMYSTLSIL